jgi:tetratricopeptide (TPR) repeat protein
LTLTVGLAFGGCATVPAAGGGGPLVSPTGRVYEPGIRPTQTRFAQAATLSNALGRYDQALREAQEGIAADPENPLHYFLAGEAAVGLNEYELADSMWIIAENIYPAYELEIEPTREAAWAAAFNEGVERYNSGDIRGAVEEWGRADLIYKLRPEAAMNLAIALTQEGDYDEAARVYRDALESLNIEPGTRIIDEEEMVERDDARRTMQRDLVQILMYTDQLPEAETLLRDQLRDTPGDIDAQANLGAVLSALGRDAEATEIYTRLLAVPDLHPEEMFNVGVALFNSEDFERSAQAFERVTQARPEGRDGWFNRANALYAAEAWPELVTVGERLVQVDPLNSTASLLLAQAYRQTDQSQRALSTLEHIDTVPVYIDDLQIRPAGQRTSVVGRVIGNAADAGTAVRLRFHFLDDSGPVGTETVTVTAPARDVSEVFDVSIDRAATVYRYELVQ